MSHTHVRVIAPQFVFGKGTGARHGEELKIIQRQPSLDQDGADLLLVQSPDGPGTFGVAADNEGIKEITP